MGDGHSIGLLLGENTVNVQNHSVPGEGVQGLGQAVALAGHKLQTGKKGLNSLPGGGNPLFLPMIAQGNGLSAADGDGGGVGLHPGSEGIRVTQVNTRFVQNHSRICGEGGVGENPVTVGDDVGGCKNHLTQKCQHKGKGNAYRQQVREEILSV